VAADERSFGEEYLEERRKLKTWIRSIDIKGKKLLSILVCFMCHHNVESILPSVEERVRSRGVATEIR
jgi:hypothetical protein